MATYSINNKFKIEPSMFFAGVMLLIAGAVWHPLAGTFSGLFNLTSIITGGILIIKSIKKED